MYLNVLRDEELQEEDENLILKERKKKGNVKVLLTIFVIDTKKE